MNKVPSRAAYKKVTRNAGLRRHRVQAATVDLGFHDVMRVNYTAHRFLVQGAVVRARFPFTDGSGDKVRPAVVVGKHGHQVTLMPLTASPRATATSDIGVQDLQVAGLHKPTKARTATLQSIDRRDVIEVLGRLSPRDSFRILLVRRAA